MSLKDDLAKLTACDRQKRLLLLEAFFFLGVMRFATLVLPFRHIIAMLGLSEGEAARNSVKAGQVPTCLLISWAIQAAAPRTPWKSACLPQALAGMAMLRLRNIPGTMYLGVARKRTADTTIQAHSWLSCEEIILSGNTELDRYVPISSFSPQQSKCGRSIASCNREASGP